jgi:predicted aconitase with swiveling domain
VKVREVGAIFKGRSILPGDIEGEACVTRTGFNTYASFYSSIHGPVDVARCDDRGNEEIFGRVLTDKVICLPKTIGSTSSGAVWQRIVQLGVAPKAILFSQRINSLAAGGLIVADVWGGERICTVDLLGDDFLQYVSEGSWIAISKDGSVTVYKARLDMD